MTCRETTSAAEATHRTEYLSWELSYLARALRVALPILARTGIPETTVGGEAPTRPGRQLGLRRTETAPPASQSGRLYRLRSSGRAAAVRSGARQNAARRESRSLATSIEPSGHDWFGTIREPPTPSALASPSSPTQPWRPLLGVPVDPKQKSLLSASAAARQLGLRETGSELAGPTLRIVQCARARAYQLLMVRCIGTTAVVREMLSVPLMGENQDPLMILDGPALRWLTRRIDLHCASSPAVGGLQDHLAAIRRSRVRWVIAGVETLGFAPAQQPGSAVHTASVSAAGWTSSIAGAGGRCRWLGGAWPKTNASAWAVSLPSAAAVLARRAADATDPGGSGLAAPKARTSPTTAVATSAMAGAAR
jgi:hypothetical protein